MLRMKKCVRFIKPGVNGVMFKSSRQLCSFINGKLGGKSLKQESIQPDMWVRATGSLASVKVRQETANQKPPPLSIPDFEDHKEAYRSKSWLQLFRGFVVFKLCSFDVLVDRQLTIIRWSRTLLGGRLFGWVMKRSLFGQFMGGETQREVGEEVRRNSRHGVQSLICYMAAETHGHGGGSAASARNMDQVYADCTSAVLGSIDLAKQIQAMNDAFPIVCAKMTTLKPAHLFKTTSLLISKNTEYVEHCGKNKETDAEARDFSFLAKQCLSGHNSQSSSASALMNMNFHLLLYKQGCRDFKAYRNATADIEVDVDGIHQMEGTLHTMAQRAEELGVVLIWDAEQTYLQSAIDMFILDSMRTHNRDRVVVHGTYQCYLKEAFDKVIRDTNLADQEGFCWGGKIVRGAYMDEERTLASLGSYEDPVNPTYEATSDMFHKVVDKLLTLTLERDVGKINTTVATHSADTVTYTINRMLELGVSPENNIRFAQIMGMRDHISFSLGQCGVPVSKLVHYGAVEDCVAWLSRRVKENRSSIITADLERTLLRRELIDRVKRKVFRN